MQQASTYQASELCGILQHTPPISLILRALLEDHSHSTYLFSLIHGTGTLDIDFSEPGFSFSVQWGSGIQHYILGFGLMGKGKEERKLRGR